MMDITEKPFNIIQIFNRSILLARNILYQNWSLIFGMSLINILVMVINKQQFFVNPIATASIDAVLILIQGIFSLSVVIYLNLSVDNALRHLAATRAELWQIVRHRFLAVVGGILTMIVIILAGCAILAIIVFGIYRYFGFGHEKMLFSSLTLLFCIIMIVYNYLLIIFISVERQKIWSAISNSFKMVHAHWGLTAVVICITSIVMMLLQIFFLHFFGLFGNFIDLLIIPWNIAVAMMMYYQLKLRYQSSHA